MGLFSPTPRPVSSVPGGTGNPIPETPKPLPLTGDQVGPDEYCGRCWDWYPVGTKHKCRNA